MSFLLCDTRYVLPGVCLIVTILWDQRPCGGVPCTLLCDVPVISVFYDETLCENAQLWYMQSARTPVVTLYLSTNRKSMPAILSVIHSLLECICQLQMDETGVLDVR